VVREDQAPSRASGETVNQRSPVRAVRSSLWLVPAGGILLSAVVSQWGGPLATLRRAIAGVLLVILALPPVERAVQGDGPTATLSDASAQDGLRQSDVDPDRLRTADLAGEHLDGLSLRGLALQGLRAPGASFEDTDLRAADLRAADLRGADLRGADLRGADLRGACLAGASLKTARLDGATFTGQTSPARR
jgi:hypothetical protein